MRLRDVNLPEELLDAQKDGRLVVFAGAGVSVGSPSSLPLFGGLAEQLSNGTLTQGREEAIDHFLRRLEAYGTDVQDLTRSIIGNPGSAPTQLHRDILSVFESPERLRIVTTNFDRHFSTAAAEIYPGAVHQYYAPALPLGRDFHGLVYLHGSVDRPSEQLILTDADFGRAYLTDGWATRFLLGVFGNYTVLFVGYSHGDPVMGYLARGLVPGTLRYALTPPGEDERWQSLGIVPICYPLRDPPERHGALGDALSAWAKLARMGALEHERRIREIVETDPVIESEETAYVENALRDAVTARFFTRHARTLAWLKWAEDRQAFRRLFEEENCLDDVARSFAAWFAQRFACDFPAEALALVQRQGQRLSPALWEAVTLELARCDPQLHPEAFAMWAAVLLETVPSSRSMDSLEFLLLRCRVPEDSDSAILLFDYLTRPHLRLTHHFGVADEESSGLRQVDIDVVTEGDSYWLQECWQKRFRPSLTLFALRLEPILTRHLLSAHAMLRGAGRASDRWDTTSYGRSAIEPHEQDSHREGFDTVIDAARDTLVHLLVHEPDQGAHLIERWASSDVPLLRRLAVHGVTESPQLGADDKIDWLVQRDWLLMPDLKHEVFRLLAEAYPSGSQGSRERVVEAAARGIPESIAQHLKARTREYEVYNLLGWLHAVAPDCPLAAEAFRAAQECHSDFAPREHPDLGHYMTVGWEGPESPVTAEWLLEQEPAEILDLLLTYQGEHFAGANREGLLAEVSKAVGKKPGWGERLASLLSEGQHWTFDLWESTIKGWQEAELTEEEWEGVLPLLHAHGDLGTLAMPVARLLVNGVEKGDGQIPSSCLSAAEQLASDLLAYCRQEPDGRNEPMFDWLTTAINHAAGEIVHFWVLVLSRMRAQAGEAWTGLPEGYRERFGSLVGGETYVDNLGRVILASQLHFLFATDRDWTRKNLVPLLDWSRDEAAAEQAWHGYLTWGRLNEALLADLMPLYEQTFQRLGILPQHLRNRFCGHLASIAVFSSSNPIKDGWLWSFLRQADPEDRQAWAETVTRQLSSIPEDGARDLWNRWLDQYWAERNTGRPLPLSDAERGEMLLWSISLRPVFAAVVGRICSAPPPPAPHHFFYRQLSDGKFPARYPEASSRLLLHALRGAAEPFHYCDEVSQLVRALVASAAPRDQVAAICERLATLGCTQAADLASLADQPPAQ